METSNQNPTFLACMNIVNTVTQLLLGAIAIGAIMYANQIFGTASFTQHIYLCVIGYIVLMAQAILSMNPWTGWASSFKHEDRKNIHWIMQIVGSILALTGSIIRISGVYSHFQSAHGFFGIFAMVFTFLSLIGGVANLFSNSIRNVNPKIVKICHSAIGCITITCAFLTLIFGFDKAVYRNVKGNTNAGLMIAFAVFALIGTLFAACNNVVKRIRS